MSKTDDHVESIPTDNETDDEIKAYLTDLEEDEESIVYDSASFVSGPYRSERCTMPEQILDFDFSYGYSCRKLFNLVVLDGNTIVFASGNFLNFFEVDSRKISFRRSALGGGIGHIRKNPNPAYSHFAVAESGKKPLIIIYEWTSLEIVCLLRGGADKVYVNLDYSPDGELLVSQSGEPDYLITIFNWQEHRILLRTKSYVNDVYRVKFSPYVPGQLTTSGIAHIKFWNMATTFTGLKLKGEIGRFGKTEYSDIYGVLPMPDEKVVSGCDWGNILVWDEGLIKLEIFRTLRRTCHDGSIMQFFYDEGELWSVSLDGHIRVWWYEKIEQADPPDDDRVILLDPSCDFYIPGTMLYCIVKQYDDLPNSTSYFAQDGNGGIWLIDISTVNDPQPPIQIYKCHAGAVVDLATCPYSKYLASLGQDGRLYVYNFIEKKRVFDYEFPAKGVCMIWLSTEVIRTGDVIIAAFDDGQLRVCCLNFYDEKNITLTIVQITKPHNKPVTKISFNPTNTILVSTSEDSTMFIYKVDKPNVGNLLVPIGFIPTPDIVNCITWHPNKETEVLVGCSHGKMMQVELPTEPQDYTRISLLLNVEPQYKNFLTYKSQIRRDNKLREIEERKAKKREKKRKEMERIQKENPGLEIDEDIFLADSESEEELEPLFIPEVPNKILWLKYTEEQTIWVSMGGFDAGYIYEYIIDQKEDIPYRFKMVDDADNIEISSYVYSHNNDYLVFAMQDGSIRFNKVNQYDFRDLSNYWIMAMHDNQNGFVPRMCFSCDEKYFFSCGHDGNVFSYIFQPEDYIFKAVPGKVVRIEIPTAVQDVDGYNKLSMEETMIKAESDRIQKVANERKAQVRETLKILRERYNKVLIRNSKLLTSQRISKSDLELDERVTEYVDQSFDSKLALVKRTLAYDLEKSEVQMKKLLKYLTDPVDLHPLTVHGINKPELYLMTVRQRTLPKLFYTTMEMVEQKLNEQRRRGRPSPRSQLPSKIIVQKSPKAVALEYFLLSLSPSIIEKKLGPTLDRILQRYRSRREKWDHRSEQWEEFMARKPISGKNHPDDEILLAQTVRSIGDYKLKESADYKASPENRDTTLKKYNELLLARLKQFNLRHDFIQEVWNTRDKKYSVRNKLLELLEQLKRFHQELPKEYRKYGPRIPNISQDEFPEENLKPRIVISEEEEGSETESVKETVVEEPTRDEEQKELFINMPDFPPISKGIFVDTYPQIGFFCEYEFEKLTEFADYTSTPFETSQRVRRLNKILFKQDQVVKVMDELIEDFNQTIIEVQKKRLPIHVGGNFVDIFIVTLNQELNILRQYEAGEDNLSSKVNGHQKLVNDLQDKMDVLNDQRESNEIQIDIISQEETKLQEKFKHATENNKFFDFLKKVFRKKYKPPKMKTDDDTSSESSSSSSSEESETQDNASIDSRDFGFIKQDLNVCPKGCEQAIFDLTVRLRSKRHELEMGSREKNRFLEQVKKDIEVAMRKMNVLKAQLKASQTELEDYQREKQRRLNQVNCTVVLNINQIIDFTPETGEISDYIVFSKTALTNLYRRVGVLEKEDFQQKEKFHTNFLHLTRMKKDLMYMKMKIAGLKNEMVSQMYEKFGRIVDIGELELALLQKSFQKTYVNELEEVVLKRLVYDLRIKLTDVKSHFVQIFNTWNRKIARAQEELVKTIKDNTLKLELLEVISREKKELIKIVLCQPKKKENIEKTQHVLETFCKDVEKLQSLLSTQQVQLQELKDEIKMLKTKGLPPPPIGEKAAEEAVKSASKGSPAKRWSEYDSYIQEEAALSERKQFVQEIKLPGYYSTESEDIVRNLLNDLLVKVKEHHDQKSVENMVRSILTSIIKCRSSEEIAHEILGNVSVNVTPAQKLSVEDASKKLYKIQDPDGSDETFEFCAKELLEEIINGAMKKLGIPPIEMVANVIHVLVENVPVDYLLRNESLNIVADKLEGILNTSEVDKEQITEVVGHMDSIYKDEILEILNIVLGRVYSTNNISS